MVPFQSTQLKCSFWNGSKLVDKGQKLVELWVHGGKMMVFHNGYLWSTHDG